MIQVKHRDAICTPIRERNLLDNLRYAADNRDFDKIKEVEQAVDQYHRLCGKNPAFESKVNMTLKMSLSAADLEYLRNSIPVVTRMMQNNYPKDQIHDIINKIESELKHHNRCHPIQRYFDDPLPPEICDLNCEHKQCPFYGKLVGSPCPYRPPKPNPTAEKETSWVNPEHRDSLRP